MDEAVLAAYGWEDIQLRHDFYEVDYLSENDRVRYTIHPDARKEVLKRLLLLNHERFEEEVAQGLHKMKGVEAYFQQKGESIPEGTKFSDSRGSAKNRDPKKAAVKTASQPKTQYGMFDQAPKLVSDKSKVTLQKTDGSTFKYHLLKNAVKGQFTEDYKQIDLESALAQAMYGKQEGDEVEFGGVHYTVKSLSYD
ncbi:MAG: hypothetical protein ACJAXB_002036 [Candidatus Endobugula sp.]|jgi:hypothetical protein